MPALSSDRNLCASCHRVLGIVAKPTAAADNLVPLLAIPGSDLSCIETLWGLGVRGAVRETCILIKLTTKTRLPYFR
jgi:hypothetical protein